MSKKETYTPDPFLLKIGTKPITYDATNDETLNQMVANAPQYETIMRNGSKYKKKNGTKLLTPEECK